MAGPPNDLGIYLFDAWGNLNLVYRDPAIVVGTLTTCFLAVGTTLLLLRAFGVGIGLLTANLVTIVFVLTLSHVVFITANWRRAAADGASERAAVLRGLLGVEKPRVAVKRSGARKKAEKRPSAAPESRG